MDALIVNPPTLADIERLEKLKLEMSDRQSARQLELQSTSEKRRLVEQEKRLEKRSDLLDQKLDLINKKEREFDSIRRSLSEQQDEVHRRTAEVNTVLAGQREAEAKPVHGIGQKAH